MDAYIQRDRMLHRKMHSGGKPSLALWRQSEIFQSDCTSTCLLLISSPSSSGLLYNRGGGQRQRDKEGERERGEDIAEGCFSSSVASL